MPRKGRSNGEINRELSALRRCFTVAIKHGVLLHRPWFDLLPEAAARRDFFDAAQIANVCRHLSPVVAAIARFGFITSWRVESEVLPLEWSRVAFTTGIVSLARGTTKTGEPRWFKMTADLRTLPEDRWQEHERAKRQGFIVPQVFFRWKAKGRGGDLEPHPVKSFIKGWRTACRKAGLPGHVPHALRRSAVRTFVRAGLSEHVAMTLSGHKTRSMLQRYDITSHDDIADAAARLDACAPFVHPGPRKGGRRGPTGRVS